MPIIVGGHNCHRKMNIVNRNEVYILYEVYLIYFRIIFLF